MTAFSRNHEPPPDEITELTPSEIEAAMSRIYLRGDGITAVCLILHALIAVGIAFFYETWLITGVATVCALAMFGLCVRLLPGRAFTRAVGGLALQIFVALHIYQMHGLPELHFFFFTSITALIVYQDWKCLWPAAIFIIVQHLSFALLHNTGTNTYFFEDSYIGATKLAFHFGIVIVQVTIAGGWAHLMRQQTLTSALEHKRILAINDRLNSEVQRRRETDEALLQASQRYQLLANNVPGMVYQFVRDPDGGYRFTFVSEGARDIYEMEPEVIRSHTEQVFAMAHPEDAASLAESIERSAATLTPWHWEGRVRFERDRLKWIEGFSQPTRREDGSISWDGVVIETTARKLAEAEMHQAKEEAERANLAKSEFLSRMSHELRTPLNAILGFGQLLEIRPLDPDQQQSVQHILKGGRHLLTLVNEVLDIAKIEVGELSFSVEIIALGPLVEEVASLVSPLAAARRITLLALPVERHRHVRADMQRLRQVLLNLLSNAIKYNCDDGRVEIFCETIPASVAGTADDFGWTRIGIRDTGPGIEEASLPRLFTPFDRLGAEKLDIEGSGIGLALCKRLTEAMGGKIGVHSTPGIGSTFYVDLPTAVLPDDFVEEGPAAEADAATDRADGEATPGKPALPPKTILQIEDNAANRYILERLFDDHEPEIRLLTAIQGQIGLELAREHQPDLILLDLHLPDLPGAEVLTRLRADPKTSNIPVIVISADATQRQMDRLIALGAWHYLTKPFDLTTLLDLIDHAFGAPDVS